MIGIRRPTTAFGITLVGVALLCAIALAPGTASPVTETSPSCAPEAASQATSPVSCEAAPADGVSRDDARPPRRGYCQCSCGAPCTTSADCGGAACRPFITCC